MTQATHQPREAFLEWLRGRASGDYPGTLNDVISLEGGHHDLKVVIGQLWDCKDPLPSAGCAKANMPAGSSFAQAVRAERQWLDRRR